MIVQATSNQTPDATQSFTSAVSGNTNTSHGSTNSSVTIGPEESNDLAKTCRWLSFPSVPANKVTLQFNWSISGSLTLTAAAPGSTAANALFKVDYSVDNGANWINVVTRSFHREVNGTTPISDGGSVSLQIPAPNSNVVQVRDRIGVDASSTIDPTVAATADLTGSIDTIQLDVQPVGLTHTLVMM